MQGSGMRQGRDKRYRVVTRLDVGCVWSELAERDALQSCIHRGAGADGRRQNLNDNSPSVMPSGER